MALIFCPECGTQVSEHAEVCSKCAYPIYKIKVSNLKEQNINSNITDNNVHKQTSNLGLIVTGYVFAFIALLFYPIVFAPAGVVIGIVTLSKGETGHGVAHISLSVVLGILGFILGVFSYLF
jgi:hypothetical protein